MEGGVKRGEGGVKREEGVVKCWEGGVKRVEGGVEGGEGSRSAFFSFCFIEMSFGASTLFVCLIRIRAMRKSQPRRKGHAEYPSIPANAISYSNKSTFSWRFFLSLSAAANCLKVLLMME